VSAGGIKMTLSITSSIAVGTFATVILAIASNRIHLTVAALLGTVVLLVTGVLSARDVSETINPAEAMIALFFGGMVMARTLIATGLFDYLGAIGLRLVRGDGRRLLFAIAGLAAPICAFLPNATVVILIGPLIVAVCERMKIDFVPPLILLVFVANSSGLLTLVGDPATFIVGNSIGLSFTQYLRLLSPGGVLAIGAVLALLPFSFRSIWRVRLPELETISIPGIKRPWVLLACLAAVGLMIMLFIYGDDLPNPIAPPEAAIIGSALLLMIVFVTGLDDVGKILHDIDWESLLFLICIFILVGALDKTGVIADLGSFLGTFFGNNVVLASLFLLTGIGVLSSVVPNVALVVAMLPLVKQYAVGAGLVAPAALEAGYGQIPSSVLPLFFAMCFGATLGGNATLLGAGSNIIAGGICARAGRQISFLTFLRYGIPVTAVQLCVSAIYIWLRFL
jgi:Na+/H+ antiporter NhaD/arsenite permease-like protein